MTDVQTFRNGRTIAHLWTGILAGPLAWALDEGMSYVLVPHACSTGHYYVLHVMTALCLLIPAAAFLLAWRMYVITPPSSTEDGGDAGSRSHFMAIIGMASSALFFLAIIAEAIPRFILNPCD
ncbi:MAG: hypothetical protein DMG65_26195 [Candidatus Angelobacter sp. Gp1-AA117]|nr:MAG: hypothetical protein DMG65_26195 [Candidatus Angelobacter sp. Gp1-AA117]